MKLTDLQRLKHFRLAAKTARNLINMEFLHEAPLPLKHSPMTSENQLAKDCRLLEGRRRCLPFSFSKCLGSVVVFGFRRGDKIASLKIQYRPRS